MPTRRTPKGDTPQVPEEVRKERFVRKSVRKNPHPSKGRSSQTKAHEEVNRASSPIMHSTVLTKGSWDTIPTDEQPSSSSFGPVSVEVSVPQQITEEEDYADEPELVQNEPNVTPDKNYPDKEICRETLSNALPGSNVNNILHMEHDYFQLGASSTLEISSLVSNSSATNKVVSAVSPNLPEPLVDDNLVYHDESNKGDNSEVNKSTGSNTSDRTPATPLLIDERSRVISPKRQPPRTSTTRSALSEVYLQPNEEGINDSASELRDPDSSSTIFQSDGQRGSQGEQLPLNEGVIANVEGALSSSLGDLSSPSYSPFKSSIHWQSTPLTPLAESSSQSQTKKKTVLRRLKRRLFSEEELVISQSVVARKQDAGGEAESGLSEMNTDNMVAKGQSVKRKGRSKRAYLTFPYQRRRGVKARQGKSVPKSETRQQESSIDVQTIDSVPEMQDGQDSVAKKVKFHVPVPVTSSTNEVVENAAQISAEPHVEENVECDLGVNEHDRLELGEGRKKQLSGSNSLLGSKNILQKSSSKGQGKTLSTKETEVVHDPSLRPATPPVEVADQVIEEGNRRNFGKGRKNAKGRNAGRKNQTNLEEQQPCLNRSTCSFVGRFNNTNCFKTEDSIIAVAEIVNYSTEYENVPEDEISQLFSFLNSDFQLAAQ